MGPLTYKVFNRYFSVRCGTYNSHLHTTLPLKCESINSSCSPFKLKRKLFYLLVSSLLVSPQTDRHACTVVAAFCANRPAATVVPIIERDSDTTVGSLKGAWGTVHIEDRTTAQARETLHSYLKP